MDARTDSSQAAAATAPPTAAPPPAAPKRTGANRQRLFIILGAVVAIGAIIYLLDWVFIGSHHVTTDDAYVNADVAEVTPLVSGPIIAAPVTDTLPVKRGQVLVVIDPTDFKLALAADEAALGQAVRKVQGYFANVDSSTAMTAAKAADVDHARAQLLSAESDMAKARTDLDRRQALSKDGAVSGDELTVAENRMRETEADVSGAKAALAEAQANRLNAVGQAKAADVLVAGADLDANPEVAAAQAKVDQAKLDLERTTIRAPIDGVIAKNTVEVGQRVASGAQLMTVVPIQDVYIDANFKEGQLRKMKIGQPVTLTSDLYGGGVKFHGKVQGLAGGTGSAFAVIPAQNATGNWIKVVQRLPVRIALDPGELKDHPLQVGLSMNVDVDIAKLDLAEGPDMAATYAAHIAEPVPLKGGMLILAAFLLAGGNFMVVLDMTIANVSVPNIAGGLAVSPSQGTWVITSYSVAEAIVVPLTGWLAGRFGAVRVFVAGILGFGVCSALCGLAPSLGMLVTFRVMQGLCGGPIMPMSQTLMMRVFPPAARGQAMGLWAMTTVTAPIAGPILGGVLCDTAGWPWVFYINVPVAVVCGFFAWRLLASQETPTERRRIDFTGLGLLILFVGALQIMLDKGEQLDWFGSPVIVGLAIVSAVGFVAFVIWELTDDSPIVDLRIFRHRGFTGAVLTIGITFGAFFASIVLVPLWLQTNMGYTATWAGYTTALGGVLAVVLSPVVPRLMQRFDARALVSFGVAGLGVVALVRTQFASNADYWTIALTFLVQGAFMPFFFVPTTQIALSSVLPQETASAAGLSNFLRTTSAAFCASLTTTLWDNGASRNHANMAGALNNAAGVQATLTGGGMSSAQALNQIDNLTQSQAVMLSTDQMFMIMTVGFVFAACVVWLAPKPNLSGGPPAGGGH